MKRLDFLKSDWFFGVIVIAAFLVFNAASDFILNLETWAYDLGVRATSRAPNPSVRNIRIARQCRRA